MGMLSNQSPDALAFYQAINDSPEQWQNYLRANLAPTPTRSELGLTDRAPGQSYNDWYQTLPEYSPDLQKGDQYRDYTGFTRYAGTPWSQEARDLRDARDIATEGMSRETDQFYPTYVDGNGVERQYDGSTWKGPLGSSEFSRFLESEEGQQYNGAASGLFGPNPDNQAAVDWQNPVDQLRLKHMGLDQESAEKRWPNQQGMLTGGSTVQPVTMAQRQGNQSNQSNPFAQGDPEMWKTLAGIEDKEGFKDLAEYNQRTGTTGYYQRPSDSAWVANNAQGESNVVKYENGETVNDRVNRLTKDGYGDNTNTIDDWNTAVYHMQQNDPQTYARWEQANPVDAIRYNALMARKGMNPERTGMTSQDYQGRADQLGYALSQQMGYGEDGMQDGKTIATNFAGNQFKDITNAWGAGDIMKIGTPSAMKGGLTDFVNDNPLESLGVLATSVLAPYAAPYVGGGIAAGAGAGAINSGLLGGDLGDVATGALLGGLSGGGADALGNAAQAGLGFAPAATEIAKAPTWVDAVLNAGRGAADVAERGSRYDPNGPMIGGTQTQSRPGWHWEVNPNNPDTMIAVPDDPAVGGGGGGGGSPDVEYIPVNHAPRDDELWRHTNPDGSVVAGNDVGEVWQVEGETPEDVDWVSIGALLGALGSIFGDTVGDTTAGGGSGGTGGTGGSGGTGGTGGAGTGTGTGTGDGDGDGEFETQPTALTVNQAASPKKRRDLFDYTRITPAERLQLAPMIDQVAALRGRR